MNVNMSDKLSKSEKIAAAKKKVRNAGKIDT